MDDFNKENVRTKTTVIKGPVKRTSRIVQRTTNVERYSWRHAVRIEGVEYVDPSSTSASWLEQEVEDSSGNPRIDLNEHAGFERIISDTPIGGIVQSIERSDSGRVESNVSGYVSKTESEKTHQIIENQRETCKSQPQSLNPKSEDLGAESSEVYTSDLGGFQVLKVQGRESDLSKQELDQSVELTGSSQGEKTLQRDGSGKVSLRVYTGSGVTEGETEAVDASAKHLKWVLYPALNSEKLETGSELREKFRVTAKQIESGDGTHNFQADEFSSGPRFQTYEYRSPVGELIETGSNAERTTFKGSETESDSITIAGVSREYPDIGDNSDGLIRYINVDSDGRKDGDDHEVKWVLHIAGRYEKEVQNGGKKRTEREVEKELVKDEKGSTILDSNNSSDELSERKEKKQKVESVAIKKEIKRKDVRKSENSKGWLKSIFRVGRSKHGVPDNSIDETNELVEGRHNQESNRGGADTIEFGIREDEDRSALVEWSSDGKALVQINSRAVDDMDHNESRPQVITVTTVTRREGGPGLDDTKAESKMFLSDEQFIGTGKIDASSIRTQEYKRVYKKEKGQINGATSTESNESKTAEPSRHDTVGLSPTNEMTEVIVEKELTTKASNTNDVVDEHSNYGRPTVIRVTKSESKTGEKPTVNESALTSIDGNSLAASISRVVDDVDRDQSRLKVISVRSIMNPEQENVLKDPTAILRFSSIDEKEVERQDERKSVDSKGWLKSIFRVGRSRHGVPDKGIEETNELLEGRHNQQPYRGEADTIEFGIRREDEDRSELMEYSADGKPVVQNKSRVVDDVDHHDSRQQLISVRTITMREEDPAWDDRKRASMTISSDEQFIDTGKIQVLGIRTQEDERVYEKPTVQITAATSTERHERQTAEANGHDTVDPNPTNVMRKPVVEDEVITKASNINDVVDDHTRSGRTTVIRVTKRDQMTGEKTTVNASLLRSKDDNPLPASIARVVDDVDHDPSRRQVISVTSISSRERDPGCDDTNSESTTILSDEQFIATTDRDASSIRNHEDERVYEKPTGKISAESSAEILEWQAAEPSGHDIVGPSATNDMTKVIVEKKVITKASNLNDVDEDSRSTGPIVIRVTKRESKTGDKPTVNASVSSSDSNSLVASIARNVDDEDQDQSRREVISDSSISSQEKEKGLNDRTAVLGSSSVNVKEIKRQDERKSVDSKGWLKSIFRVGRSKHGVPYKGIDESNELVEGRHNQEPNRVDADTIEFGISEDEDRSALPEYSNDGKALVQTKSRMVDDVDHYDSRPQVISVAKITRRERYPGLDDRKRESMTILSDDQLIGTGKIDVSNIRTREDERVYEKPTVQITAATSTESNEWQAAQPSGHDTVSPSPTKDMTRPIVEDEVSTMAPNLNDVVYELPTPCAPAVIRVTKRESTKDEKPTVNESSVTSTDGNSLVASTSRQVDDVDPDQSIRQVISVRTITMRGGDPIMDENMAASKTFLSDKQLIYTEDRDASIIGTQDERRVYKNPTGQIIGTTSTESKEWQAAELSGHDTVGPSPTNDMTKPIVGKELTTMASNTNDAVDEHSSSGGPTVIMFTKREPMTGQKPTVNPSSVTSTDGNSLPAYIPRVADDVDPDKSRGQAISVTSISCREHENGLNDPTAVSGSSSVDVKEVERQDERKSEDSKGWLKSIFRVGRSKHGVRAKGIDETNELLEGRHNQEPNRLEADTIEFGIRRDDEDRSALVEYSAHGKPVVQTTSGVVDDVDLDNSRRQVISVRTITKREWSPGLHETNSGSKTIISDEQLICNSERDARSIGTQEDVRVSDKPKGQISTESSPESHEWKNAEQKDTVAPRPTNDMIKSIVENDVTTIAHNLNDVLDKHSRSGGPIVIRFTKRESKTGDKTTVNASSVGSTDANSLSASVSTQVHDVDHNESRPQVISVTTITRREVDSGCDETSSASRTILSDEQFIGTAERDASSIGNLEDETVYQKATVNASSVRSTDVDSLAASICGQFDDVDHDQSRHQVISFRTITKRERSPGLDETKSGSKTIISDEQFICNAERGARSIETREDKGVYEKPTRHISIESSSESRKCQKPEQIDTVGPRHINDMIESIVEKEVTTKASSLNDGVNEHSRSGGPTVIRVNERESTTADIPTVNLSLLSSTDGNSLPASIPTVVDDVDRDKSRGQVISVTSTSCREHKNVENDPTAASGSRSLDEKEVERQDGRKSEDSKGLLKSIFRVGRSKHGVPDNRIDETNELVEGRHNQESNRAGADTIEFGISEDEDRSALVEWSSDCKPLLVTKTRVVDDVDHHDSRPQVISVRTITMREGDPARDDTKIASMTMSSDEQFIDTGKIVFSGIKTQGYKTTGQITGATSTESHETRTNDPSGHDTLGQSPTNDMIKSIVEKEITTKASNLNDVVDDHTRSGGPTFIRVTKGDPMTADKHTVNTSSLSTSDGTSFAQYISRQVDDVDYDRSNPQVISVTTITRREGDPVWGDRNPASKTIISDEQFIGTAERDSSSIGTQEDERVYQKSTVNASSVSSTDWNSLAASTCRQDDDVDQDDSRPQVISVTTITRQEGDPSRDDKKAASKTISSAEQFIRTMDRDASSIGTQEDERAYVKPTVQITVTTSTERDERQTAEANGHDTFGPSPTNVMRKPVVEDEVTTKASNINDVVDDHTRSGRTTVIRVTKRDQMTGEKTTVNESLLRSKDDNPLPASIARVVDDVDHDQSRRQVISVTSISSRERDPGCDDTNSESTTILSDEQFIATTDRDASSIRNHEDERVYEKPTGKITAATSTESNELQASEPSGHDTVGRRPTGDMTEVIVDEELNTKATNTNDVLDEHSTSGGPKVIIVTKRNPMTGEKTTVNESLLRSNDGNLLASSIARVVDDVDHDQSRRQVISVTSISSREGDPGCDDTNSESITILSDQQFIARSDGDTPIIATQDDKTVYEKATVQISPDTSTESYQWQTAKQSRHDTVNPRHTYDMTKPIVEDEVTTLASNPNDVVDDHSTSDRPTFIRVNKDESKTDEKLTVNESSVSSIDGNSLSASIPRVVDDVDRDKLRGQVISVTSISCREHKNVENDSAAGTISMSLDENEVERQDGRKSEDSKGWLKSIFRVGRSKHEVPDERTDESNELVEGRHNQEQNRVEGDTIEFGISEDEDRSALVEWSSDCKPLLVTKTRVVDDVDHHDSRPQVISVRTITMREGDPARDDTTIASMTMSSDEQFIRTIDRDASTIGTQEDERIYEKPTGQIIAESSPESHEWKRAEQSGHDTLGPSPTNDMIKSIIEKDVSTKASNLNDVVDEHSSYAGTTVIRVTKQDSTTGQKPTVNESSVSSTDANSLAASTSRQVDDLDQDQSRPQVISVTTITSREVDSGWDETNSASKTILSDDQFIATTDIVASTIGTHEDKSVYEKPNAEISAESSPESLESQMADQNDTVGLRPTNEMMKSIVEKQVTTIASNLNDVMDDLSRSGGPTVIGATKRVSKTGEKPTVNLSLLSSTDGNSLPASIPTVVDDVDRDKSRGQAISVTSISCREHKNVENDPTAASGSRSLDEKEVERRDGRKSEDSKGWLKSIFRVGRSKHEVPDERTDESNELVEGRHNQEQNRVEADTIEFGISEDEDRSALVEWSSDCKPLLVTKTRVVDDVDHHDSRPQVISVRTITMREGDPARDDTKIASMTMSSDEQFIRTIDRDASSIGTQEDERAYVKPTVQITAATSTESNEWQQAQPSGHDIFGPSPNNDMTKSIIEKEVTTKASNLNDVMDDYSRSDGPTVIGVTKPEPMTGQKPTVNESSVSSTDANSLAASTSRQVDDVDHDQSRRQVIQVTSISSREGDPGCDDRKRASMTILSDDQFIGTRMIDASSIGTQEDERVYVKPTGQIIAESSPESHEWKTVEQSGHDTLGPRPTNDMIKSIVEKEITTNASNLNVVVDDHSRSGGPTVIVVTKPEPMTGQKPTVNQSSVSSTDANSLAASTSRQVDDLDRDQSRPQVISVTTITGREVDSVWDETNSAPRTILSDEKFIATTDIVASTIRTHGDKSVYEKPSIHIITESSPESLEWHKADQNDTVGLRPTHEMMKSIVEKQVTTIASNLNDVMDDYSRSDGPTVIGVTKRQSTTAVIPTLNASSLSSTDGVPRVANDSREVDDVYHDHSRTHGISFTSISSLKPEIVENHPPPESTSSSLDERMTYTPKIDLLSIDGHHDEKIYGKLTPHTTTVATPKRFELDTTEHTAHDTLSPTSTDGHITPGVKRELEYTPHMLSGLIRDMSGPLDSHASPSDIDHEPCRWSPGHRRQPSLLGVSMFDVTQSVNDLSCETPHRPASSLSFLSNQDSSPSVLPSEASNIPIDPSSSITFLVGMDRLVLNQQEPKPLDLKSESIPSCCVSNAHEDGLAVKSEYSPDPRTQPVFSFQGPRVPYEVETDTIDGQKLSKSSAQYGFALESAGIEERLTVAEQHELRKQNEELGFDHQGLRGTEQLEVSSGSGSTKQPSESLEPCETRSIGESRRPNDQSKLDESEMVSVFVSQQQPGKLSSESGQTWGLEGLNDRVEFFHADTHQEAVSRPLEDPNSPKPSGEVCDVVPAEAFAVLSEISKGSVPSRSMIAESERQLEREQTVVELSGKVEPLSHHHELSARETTEDKLGEKVGGQKSINASLANEQKFSISHRESLERQDVMQQETTTEVPRQHKYSSQLDPAEQIVDLNGSLGLNFECQNSREEQTNEFTRRKNDERFDIVSDIRWGNCSQTSKTAECKQTQPMTTRLDQSESKTNAKNIPGYKKSHCRPYDSEGSNAEATGTKPGIGIGNENESIEESDIKAEVESENLLSHDGGREYESLKGLASHEREKMMMNEKGKSMNFPTSNTSQTLTSVTAPNLTSTSTSTKAQTAHTSNRNSEASIKLHDTLESLRLAMNESVVFGSGNNNHHHYDYCNPDSDATNSTTSTSTTKIISTSKSLIKQISRQYDENILLFNSQHEKRQHSSHQSTLGHAKLEPTPIEESGDGDWTPQKTSNFGVATKLSSVLQSKPQRWSNNDGYQHVDESRQYEQLDHKLQRELKSLERSKLVQSLAQQGAEPQPGQSNWQQGKPIRQMMTTSISESQLMGDRESHLRPQSERNSRETSMISSSHLNQPAIGSSNNINMNNIYPANNNTHDRQQRRFNKGKFVNYYASWRQPNPMTGRQYQNYSFHLPQWISNEGQSLYSNQIQNGRYGFIVPTDRLNQSKIALNENSKSIPKPYRSRTISHLPSMVKFSATSWNDEENHNLDVGPLESSRQIVNKITPQLSERVPDETQRVHKIVLNSADSYDNPFKPGTELSWEADLMVKLMQRGYPIQELPLLVESAKQVAKEKNSILIGSSPELAQLGSSKSTGENSQNTRPLQDARGASRNSRNLNRQKPDRSVTSIEQVWASSLGRARSLPRYMKPARNETNEVDSLDQLISSIENEIESLRPKEQQIGESKNDLGFTGERSQHKDGKKQTQGLAEKLTKTVSIKPVKKDAKKKNEDMRKNQTNQVFEEKRTQTKKVTKESVTTSFDQSKSQSKFESNIGSMSCKLGQGNSDCKTSEGAEDKRESGRCWKCCCNCCICQRR